MFPISIERCSLQRYFHGQAPTIQPLNAKEYYAQRKEIAALFGHGLWYDEHLPGLLNPRDYSGQSRCKAGIPPD